MTVIYAMWISVIVLSAMNIAANKEKKLEQSFKRRSETILFLGSLAFLIGVLGQLIGIFHALGAIQVAKDISPAVIMGGLRVSMLPPAYGFVLFIISGIVWFVFRNITTKKSKD